jgi:hypothetical protein
VVRQSINVYVLTLFCVAIFEEEEGQLEKVSVNERYFLLQ